MLCRVDAGVLGEQSLVDVGGLADPTAKLGGFARRDELVSLGTGRGRRGLAGAQLGRSRDRKAEENDGAEGSAAAHRQTGAVHEETPSAGQSRRTGGLYPEFAR
jgi:hypothetical protein